MNASVVGSLLSNVAEPLTSMVSDMYKTKEDNKTQQMHDVEYMAVAGLVILVAGGVFRKAVRDCKFIDIQFPKFKATVQK